MKKHLTLLFLSLLFIYSCQKTTLQEDFGWNSLAFTESASTNYSEYMNEPHINISFPSKTGTKSINYEKGIWTDNNKTYVFIAHNWADQEIILHIYKDKTLLNEFVLRPESVVGKEIEISMKDFSMSLQPTAGEYSFQVSIKDSRGITAMNQYPLHGSSNKMVVK